jgi:hypothetical protein
MATTHGQVRARSGGRASPRSRKALLTLHIATAAGLVGVSVVILALGIAGLGEPAPETVYPAMHTVARFALVPLAVAALATGLLQVIVTGYGLRRHWWATAKLVITVALAVVAVFVVVPGLGRAAEAATTPSAGVTSAQQLTSVVTPAIALGLFLLSVGLGVFKPGRRR